jgi:hypothetical protein
VTLLELKFLKQMYRKIAEDYAGINRTFLLAMVFHKLAHA